MKPQTSIGRRDETGEHVERMRADHRRRLQACNVHNNANSNRGAASHATADRARREGRRVTIAR